MSNLDRNTEFEVKFRVEPHTLIEFKRIVSELPGDKSLTYVEGPDHYYTHPDYDETSFGRYRKASFGLDNGRAEWTLKFRPKGAKNSIQRLEMNWRVDNTPEEDVLRGAELMGFQRNFSIVKSCHMYKFVDATLVFYTVYDITEGSKSSKVDHFIEIEVCEHLIANQGLTEKDAWAIIEKYEAALAPLDITAKNRLKRSLFDMYVRGRT